MFRLFKCTHTTKGNDGSDRQSRKPIYWKNKEAKTTTNKNEYERKANEIKWVKPVCVCWWRWVGWCELATMSACDRVDCVSILIAWF